MCCLNYELTVSPCVLEQHSLTGKSHRKRFLIFPMFSFLSLELQLFYMYIFSSVHICCWILVLHPDEESQGQFSFNWKHSFFENLAAMFFHLFPFLCSTTYHVSCHNIPIMNKSGVFLFCQWQTKQKSLRFRRQSYSFWILY